MGGVFSTADLSWVLPVAVVGGLVLVIGVYVIWKKQAPAPPVAIEPGHSPKEKVEEEEEEIVVVVILVPSPLPCSTCRMGLWWWWVHGSLASVEQGS